jgi:hypothetical protein
MKRSQGTAVDVVYEKEERGIETGVNACKTRVGTAVLNHQG